MYRPKKLMFQTGGMNEKDYTNYQENTSRYLAGEHLRDVQKLVKKRKELGKKVLSPNVYNYLINSKAPEVNRVINPATIIANESYPSYQQGGQMGQDQILQMVAQALQQGTPPEQVMQMLIEQGVPQEQAQQMIQMVMSQMQGQMSPQQPTNDQTMMQLGGMRPKGLSYDY